MIGLSLDDFWRRVRGCPADGLSKLSLMGDAAETEIDKFDVPMLIEEDVLWLDIPVAESALLEIEQS